MPLTGVNWARRFVNTQAVRRDNADHNVTQQNPADYLKGLEAAIRKATRQAEITAAAAKLRPEYLAK